MLHLSPPGLPGGAQILPLPLQAGRLGERQGVLHRVIEACPGGGSDAASKRVPHREEGTRYPNPLAVLPPPRGLIACDGVSRARWVSISGSSAGRHRWAFATGVRMCVCAS